MRFTYRTGWPRTVRRVFDGDKLLGIVGTVANLLELGLLESCTASPDAWCFAQTPEKAYFAETREKAIFMGLNRL